MKFTHVFLLTLFSLSLCSQANLKVSSANAVIGSSRALMASKTQAWQEGFMSGEGNCISVVKDAAICGWKTISAGVKCVWSYIKCIVPKCSKCCGGGIFSWACVPCRCSWNCSSNVCKEEFKKAAASCKITADACVKAFNGLGNATKEMFKNIGNALKTIINKIKQAAEWVAKKAWAAVKWVYDQILKLLDLIKFFEVAKSIGNAFKCFGKLGNKDQVKAASNNAGRVKGAAETGGKNGVISSIDGVIPGFKAMVCCMQQTAIGRVLNKWGKSLLNFHKNWKGLKVGSFLDDPALVVSLAASVSAGYSVGTSLDFAISTAFNIGIYWTLCAGFETDYSAGVSVVVNLFRKFSFIPGQSIAVSFSVGIPKTPIGVGAGVVLPIGDSGVDFGAVNVEIGRGVGVMPASVGGHVCDTKKLVEFNLIELIGNILTAGNACPEKIPANPNPAPAPPSPITPPNTGAKATWGAYHKANWWGSFDRPGWSNCPNGYAITGFYRNSCHELYCLEEAACRKPNGISSFTSCYNENVTSKFDHKGLTSCRANYYLAGLWRNHARCNEIYCIEHFRCCTSPGTKYEYSPRKQNWWSSFDRKGWSGVPTNTWITGLWRNSCSKLYCIEEAYYSRPMRPAAVGTWGAYHKANWWSSFDRPGWSNCPNGYALTGFYRNSCHELYCLEEAACRKPNNVSAFTSCYSENVTHKFDHKGLTSCRANYYLAGLWRNHARCNEIYCIEHFRCCTSPGTKYEKSPQRANWWGSFDRKGWSTVPNDQWITGLWRNSCSKLYCIEEAYYARPITARRRLEAIEAENMKADFGYKSAEEMSAQILTKHRKLLSENIEKEIREANKAADRKLLEATQNELAIEFANEEEEINTKEALAKQPVLKEKIPIDNDMCGALNIAGELAFLKYDKSVLTKFKKCKNKKPLFGQKKKCIASILCSDECQKTNQSAKFCLDARTAVCHRKWLGGDLDTVKECCEAIKTDPEHLVFRVRKFCARQGEVQKPTRSQFCKCANSAADVFQKDIDCVDAVLDGCAARMAPKGKCRRLRRKKTAAEFAKVANTLCKANTMMDTFKDTLSDKFSDMFDVEGNTVSNNSMFYGSVTVGGLFLLSGGLYLVMSRKNQYEYEPLIDQTH